MSTEHPADHVPQTTDLAGVVADAHARVLQALEDPERHGATAVAWASAHLAATEKVLYGAAHHALRESARGLRPARLADHGLQRAVFRLDRRLTGDTHLDATPVERVAQEVRGRLGVHARAERRVLDALTQALTPEQLEQLGARLVQATAAAPTRPHPYTPHTPASGLVARVDALVDRVRDVLDNRVPTTGRLARAPRPLGRWGSYLMGAPYPSEHAPQRTEEDSR